VLEARLAYQAGIRWEKDWPTTRQAIDVRTRQVLGEWVSVGWAKDWPTRQTLGRRKIGLLLGRH